MPGPSNSPIATIFQSILDSYLGARAGEGGGFSAAHPVYQMFQELEDKVRALDPVKARKYLRVTASPGRGNWARVPWVALMDERETTSTQEGIYCVFLFREDATGVYLTFNQGVTKPKKRYGAVEAREILKRRAGRLWHLFHDSLDAQRDFQAGPKIDLRADGGLGRDYEHSTAACKLYKSGSVPSDNEIKADLEAALTAYDQYMDSELRHEFGSDTAGPVPPTPTLDGPDHGPPAHQPTDFSRAAALEILIADIEARGFIFEPWHVAQYMTAVRTKPFVILAGVTGTGKTRLPRLVEEATGGESHLVPVRPDWTDSSEVLGYLDLEGRFRPGRVLETAHAATAEDDVHHTLVIDEMNLARVEHYFAEVLSRIEDRRRYRSGGWVSSPLVQTGLKEDDAEWGTVRLPANLALVGTVNMDESAHGFSRKVLDRAFTVELSDVDLEAWELGDAGTAPSKTTWPVAAWWPRATRLSELQELSEAERSIIDDAVRELIMLNEILTPAQLQVGYRTRDEIALFLLHAEDVRSAFRTRSGEEVHPLDLAVQMKVLPRIAGGSGGVRRVLLGVLGWAMSGTPYEHDDDTRPAMEAWESSGRAGRVPEANLPGVAARACLMWDRLRAEGFTSYWL